MEFLYFFYGAAKGHLFSIPLVLYSKGLEMTYNRIMYLFQSHVFETLWSKEGLSETENTYKILVQIF